MMTIGMKLSAMQSSLRRCLHCHHRAISRQRSSPRSITTSSTNNSGARASQTTAATTWELEGSSIIANKGGIIANKGIHKSVISNPSWSELKNLFATSALPMVGFGFMDNFIMIQAGGYIDSTLGVKFGLATLTAAAMGQVVSDVSGVLFGSTVEHAITRTGLVHPSHLSPAQRRLPLSRRVSLAGAVIGVMVGCGLGATALLFVPHQNHSETKQKHVQKIKEVLSNMLRVNDIGSDNCTVYLADFCGEPETAETSSIQLRPMNNSDPASLHQQCACGGSTMISNSSRSQFLCTPIYGKNKSLLGVIEFAINSPERTFGEREEQLAQITARHIGVVLDHL
ncbi:hypothetical protein ACHAXR_004173 [Thalassiosira sp. AJA248-18]